MYHQEICLLWDICWGRSHSWVGWVFLQVQQLTVSFKGWRSSCTDSAVGGVMGWDIRSISLLHNWSGNTSSAISSVPFIVVRFLLNLLISGYWSYLILWQNHVFFLICYKHRSIFKNQFNSAKMLYNIIYVSRLLMLKLFNWISTIAVSFYHLKM
jgi:hypothetical protein